VLLLNPALGDRLVVGSTDQLLSAFTPPLDPASQPAHWLEASQEERQDGLRLRIHHGKVGGGQGVGRRAGRRAGPRGGAASHPASPPCSQ